MSLGLPENVASAIAPNQNELMGKCVLSLYRSAVQPRMARLGERLKTSEQRPGLVFIASEDTYVGTPEMCAAVAADLGADVYTLQGLGHWWMFEGAALAAAALVRHWERV